MSKWRLVLSVVFAAVIFGFFAYTEAPGLVRDWRLRGVETVEVPSQMTDASCRVYLFAVDFCDFKLRTADAAIEDNLLFVDVNGSGYDIAARAEAANPRNITSGLALEMFWNRAVTLAVFLVLIGLGLVAGVRKLFAPTPPPAPRPQSA